jgi:hypothetical protein
MKDIVLYIQEKLQITKDSKIGQSKKEKIKIPEKIAKDLWTACMDSENNQDIYKKYFEPLVNDYIKIKPGMFDITKSEQSDEILNLAKASIKKAKNREAILKDYIDLLRKYMLANVLKSMTGYNYELSQDQEDYMIEWDYFDGPNKIEF